MTACIALTSSRRAAATAPAAAWCFRTCSTTSATRSLCVRGTCTQGSAGNTSTCRPAMAWRSTSATPTTTRSNARHTRHLSTQPATVSTTTHTGNSHNSSSGSGEGGTDGSPLSLLGQLFFGSLCVGTFGLGCWQSRRYFEKIDQMDIREQELMAPPVPLWRFSLANDDAAVAISNNENEKVVEEKASEVSYRRYVVKGTYRHRDEVLVGPRGPPPGALASSGPSSGRSSGGMASSPQGYFVITPMEVDVLVDVENRNRNRNRNNKNGGNKNKTDKKETVLVNRGWVPMSYVKKRQHQKSSDNQDTDSTNTSMDWSRPGGAVKVVGVVTKTEEPKFLSPQHDQRNPRTLLWMDRAAIEDRTRTAGRSPILLTETISTNNNDDTDSSNTGPNPFPVKPDANTVGEFKVTPFTHAGYAVTWFGLSGAGMVMTRKLLTRGR